MLAQGTSTDWRSPNFRTLFILAAMALGFTSHAHAQFANRWYVDVSATGDNDGSDWDDAFVDLQDALTRAAESDGNDEIWVAAGTYYPDSGTDDPEASFWLVDGATLYAGFVGTETDLTQRNPEKNFTILSGDIGDPGENSYHVVRAANVGPTAVLNGFTITQGFAPLLTDFGGGMRVDNSKCKIVRCVFVGNGDHNSGPGGALSIHDSPADKSDQVRVVNCSFVGNLAANHGGGVYCSASAASVHNCLFSGNSVQTTHGGAVTLQSSTGQFFTCTFSGNEAPVTGAAVVFESSAGFLRNCIVWGNTPEQEQVQNVSSIVSVYFSDIEDGWTGDGSDNINANPLFCDPDGMDDIVGTADDNLRLQDDSPCIDPGDPDIELADVGDVDDDGDSEETLPWDRDNEKPYTQWGRSFDTVNGPEAPPTKIDMGAYENQHIADCPWDIGSSGTPGPPPDGEVSTPDLLKLLADWGACPGCGADFDCNLEVGNLDYAALLTNWGECPGGESGQGGDSGLEDAVWALGFEDITSYVTWLAEEATDEDGFTSAAVVAALLSE